MSAKGWGGKGKMNMDPNMQAVMMQMMKGKGGGRWNNSDGFFDKIRQADPETKVYVEGLAEGVTWKDLQKHCEEAGHKPTLCEVMKGGRGVLVYKDAGASAEAIAALDQTKMGDNHITTDVWTKKEPSDDKPEGGGKSGGKGWRGGKGGSWDDAKNTLAKIRQQDDDKKVYVDGLPATATWKELEKHFADAGHKPGLCEVTSAGRGILLYKDAASAKAAIKDLAQSNMGGSTINTDIWTSKQGSGSSGGGGGGGWGGNFGGKGGPMSGGAMGGFGGKGGGWGGCNAGMGNFGGKGGGYGGCAPVTNSFGAKGGGYAGKGGNQAPQNTGFTCVVANIPDFIGQEEFQENLKQAGNVKSARFIAGGKAFVSFATAAEADKCVQLFNGCDVGDVLLQVHRAK